MSAETLARWQFGITTVYHFLFVPITIALSLLVAVLQTLWVKSGNERFLRLTKFYGKLFLINFAMGVVTGIVQEFQFGMNWSEYARFVGDIFGAPLALEALISFFLESVFLGMWIFGWDKLPKKIHLATIWLGAIGTLISSIFILVANSWMQNPTGAAFDKGDTTVENLRAEMTDFAAVLLNPVAAATWTHVIFGAFMTAGALIMGAAGYNLVKLNNENGEVKDVDDFRWATKFGAWVLIVASVGTIFTGHIQGQIITDLQPMKMAAAENLQKSEACAPFEIIPGVGVPCVLSFMATNDPSATVKGIDDLVAEYNEKLAAGEPLDARNQLQVTTAAAKAGIWTEGADPVDFVPPVLPTFWSFRFMMGLGFIGILIGIIVLVGTKGDKIPSGGKGWNAMMLAAPLLPLFASSFGWLVTEIGRQPYLVNGVLSTHAAVSPGVTAIEVGLTLVLYTAIYAVFAVVEVSLMLKYAKAGLPKVVEPEVQTDDDAPLSFAY
ncbi:MAG: cytochrome ubiquinol oxidase subunit I [Propionibacteriaceae bacterium]|jgi:cytochrome d ubiquinol oxidase subunit I|nr:cytochrome ubiquinol oxidase subunit I [Propionibacteriaceae bacterium]